MQRLESNKWDDITMSRHRHVEQFVDSTSEFRRSDVLSLNIRFEDAMNANEICSKSIDGLSAPQEVYVSGLSSDDVKIVATNKEALLHMERKSKTFVQLMNYILENEPLVRGTEESRTDAFVQHLLEKLEFCEYPLMVQPQPLFKFKVHTKEISSKYDFAVIKDSRVMLVDEDKHFRNTGPASNWGENQIAGEIVSGAYWNYSYNTEPKLESIKIYAVRAIGLRFTFYKAIVSSAYLDSLGDGLPSSNIVIHRYPSSSANKKFPYLDYGNTNEREQIIDLLMRMREDMIETDYF